MLIDFLLSLIGVRRNPLVLELIPQKDREPSALWEHMKAAHWVAFRILRDDVLA
jgi:hypothetical protein